jgi:hypothetical protein
MRKYSFLLAAGDPALLNALHVRLVEKWMSLFQPEDPRQTGLAALMYLKVPFWKDCRIWATRGELQDHLVNMLAVLPLPLRTEDPMEPKYRNWWFCNDGEISRELPGHHLFNSISRAERKHLLEYTLPLAHYQMSSFTDTAPFRLIKANVRLVEKYTLAHQVGLLSYTGLTWSSLFPGVLFPSLDRDRCGPSIVCDLVGTEGFAECYETYQNADLNVQLTERGSGSTVVQSAQAHLMWPDHQHKILAPVLGVLTQGVKDVYDNIVAANELLKGACHQEANWGRPPPMIVDFKPSRAGFVGLAALLDQPPDARRPNLSEQRAGAAAAFERIQAPDAQQRLQEIA